MGADGVTVGTKNTITIDCTNGQASCAGILIN
jgi:NAD(P)H-dependent flavin oxidoreductase YrpB (nitropropane dioxygenase family)